MSNITEEFTDDLGQFVDYDAYDVDVSELVRKQKHIDIRSFRQDNIARHLTVFDMSQFTMDELDDLTMDELDNLSITTVEGEGWSAGTVGPQTDRRNWLGLSLATSGTASTESVMVDQPVDISPLAATGVLSIALPAFPNSSLNLANTFIDLTSNPSGNFATGPTASIPFNTSTTTLVNGDSEFTRPVSSISGIDLSKITAVRFRIAATGSITFRVTAIRVLDPDWTYGPVDIDTRYGLLRTTPSRNGSIATPFAYTQPTLFRVGPVSGFHDPQPIDAKLGISFNTGSLSTDGQISIFLREGSQDFVTQLDLNGTTMEELNGNPQPDFGPATYQSRPQSNLDVLVQDELDDTPQSVLERTADNLAVHHVEFTLVWGGGGSYPHIEIVDSEHNGYTGFGPVSLEADTNYVFVVELVDTTARAYVYEVDDLGATVDTTYDTGLIYDSFMLKRLKGRVGWNVTFGDGDAFVDNISSRGLVFAEFRTRPFESLTPVSGVELFTTGSPPIQMFENIGLYTESGEAVVTRDKTRSTTGESWKIVNPGDVAAQGLKSNGLQFTDFENAEIWFDLFVPRTTAETAPISVFLQSRTGVLVPLITNRIVPDQWQTHHATISDLDIQTGTYQLVVLQSTQNVPSTWWIDNVKIYERTLRWQGRIDPDDPWAEEDAGWLDFEDIYNRESGGIMFGDRGTHFQVRGQAIYQSAFVNKMKVRPRYAELGRLINPSYAGADLPAPDFTSTDLGSQVIQFNGSASLDNGRIVAYEWTFGDGGSGFGQKVEHTYEVAGVYSVSLVVTDNNGNRVITTQDVTVS